MLILYDPLDENCKSVTGAAEENEPIRFCIRISGAENCVLLVFKDGISEPTEYRAERSSDFFRFSVSLKRGLYFYRFVADGTVIGRGKRGLATAYSQEKYQLTVYKKEPFPTTFYGGIMYQIFPDRFSRAEGFGDASGRKMKKWGDTPDYLPDENGKITNDDFFGGNFEGIRRKIGYLKDLGVTSVYLNPVFKARSNHRYDTGDYFSVDPLLGSEEDFKRLVGSFHENGISVVLDGVFNHTGDDSVYFDKYGNYGSFGAYRSKSSRYYKWYSFTDYPDKYASWWGIETLPSVRKDCGDFHEFIAGDGGALEKYLSFGIDGVRLDVVDELSDDFTDMINARVKKHGSEKIVIGEVWENATDKIAYGKRRRYFQGGQLDSVMNYPLKDAIISFVINGDAETLSEVVLRQINDYPSFALNNLMNILGTHDTPRILTVLGKSGKLQTDRAEMAKEKLDEEETRLAVKRLKCATLLQFTLYGFPCVYYGDEIGTEGNKDPFNRTCFDFEKRNGEIYSWYEFLCGFRKSVGLFRDGKIVGIKARGGVFSFSRTNGKETASIVVNCGFGKAEIITDRATREITRNVKTDKITLNTYDFCVFYEGGEIC